MHFLYFTPLRNFIVLSPRILVFFAGITQLYRTCGKIATYRYAPQEISQFWRFSPPSHSIVPPLPAFGRFRERHGQLPGGAGPYPQPITPSESPTQLPFLHAVFVICVSRSPTYEVLISFAAKYVSCEFCPSVSVGRPPALSRAKKSSCHKNKPVRLLVAAALFFVRSYLNEFIRKLPSMC